VNHPLANKVVLVTGASSGIGSATARSLDRCGAHLALTARNVERLRDLSDELAGETLIVPADLTIPGDIDRVIKKTIDHFSRVDVLFANAGVYVPGQVKDGDPEAWANLFDVNVMGVLRTVHAVLPHLLRQKSGDIIVTSSISGHIDIPWEPIYSASKHAVQTFVHTLRRQVASQGVRVGSIAPGMVANELWGFTDENDINRKVSAHESLRSEDVAELVVVMLSQPPHVTIRDLVVLPTNQDL
jgi:ribitol 2-dehydrogenase